LAVVCAVLSDSAAKANLFGGIIWFVKLRLALGSLAPQETRRG
jgi:hypothetical protein